MEELWKSHVKLSNQALELSENVNKNYEDLIKVNEILTCLIAHYCMTQGDYREASPSSVFREIRGLSENPEETSQFEMHIVR